MYLNGVEQSNHQINITANTEYYVSADIKYAGEFSSGYQSYQIKFDVFEWEGNGVGMTLVESKFFVQSFNTVIAYPSASDTIQIVKPLYVYENSVIANPNSIPPFSIRVVDTKFHVGKIYHKQLDLVRENTIHVFQTYLSDSQNYLDFDARHLSP